ncbi:MAG: M20/M25/M40 family metallo-hydrolase [Ruminococcus sp.]|nr:M20/M25/M40 family metallo-hydrolase [Ruminococcus sp.]
MDIKDIVFRLCSAYGASGDENNAAETALDILHGFCTDAGIVNGNVIGNFGIHQEGLPLLVLDAHIDQIGMIVTEITDDGFIKVANLGGIDRRLLPAQQVIVHGKKDIKGVICSVPPHLLKGGSSKVPEFSEISVDTGLSRGELEEIISAGDTITFDSPCRSLLNDRISGGALDDRCGIAVILLALDMLQGKKLKYNVSVIFSVQEELGERGAKIGAYRLNPDIAIAIDVSFAFAEGENRKKCGLLGRGAMIGISPCLSREVSDILISVAKEAEIPYQLEVMNGLTSTNADRYSESREGAKTCTLSVPLRNMHTPVEVIDLSDVRNMASLLAEFIAEQEH